MPVVYDAKPHSMAWCLECHRHPENFLRPEDQITNLDWKPEDVKPAEFVAKYGQPQGVTEDWSKKKHLTQAEIGQTLKERWNITTAGELPELPPMKRVFQHPPEPPTGKKYWRSLGELERHRRSFANGWNANFPPARRNWTRTNGRAATS